jgi:hypothetical protein
VKTAQHWFGVPLSNGGVSKVPKFSCDRPIKEAHQPHKIIINNNNYYKIEL